MIALIVGVLLFSSLMALINVLFYSRAYLFLFPKHFPKSWVSNIVGNFSCLDRLFTLFLGPFPELNDFNAVLTNLPTTKAYVFHGKVPLARYWGLQLFLPGARTNSTRQTLTDFEIISDDGVKVWDKDYSDHNVQRSSKEYTIVVCTPEARPEWASNWVETGSSTTGKLHLVFRGYCPFHGAAFSAPKLCIVEPSELKNFSSVQDFLQKRGTSWEKVEDEERVFGSWSAVSAKNSEREKMFRTVVFNLAVFLFLSLTVISEPFTLICLMSGTVFASYFLYERILPRRAEKRYFGMLTKKYVDQMTPERRNQNVFLPEPQGSLAGHPNHQYYTIPYDAREEDVVIEGWKTGPFRYTSVQCYSWNSLPLPQFHFDSSLESLENDPRKYVVRLTTKPNEYSSYSAPHQNVVNVSSSPVGLVLIRLIFARDEQVIKEHIPTVRPISRNAPTFPAK